MTTIKLKFRPSATVGKPGRLFYQVTHQRTVRQIRTAHRLFPAEWDSEQGRISTSGAAGARQNRLRLMAEKTNWELRRMRAVAAEWEQQGKTFTTDELTAELATLPACQTVFALFSSLIAKKLSMGQTCSARNYQTTRNRLHEFLGGQDLTFPMLSADTLERFEQWLQKERGLRRNTTSSYLRIIRTVQHTAIKAGLDSARPLFAHVYTGIDRTRKRALEKRDLQAIKSLNLATRPHLAMARDLFLLSFYLRGMPFVDMAFLKKSDLRGGFVRYCRRKTHKPMEVKWEREMQEIVSRHAHLTANSPYLMPIITRHDGTERSQYERAMGRQNRNLKTIGRMANVATPLTQYAARHSWASLAYNSDVPISIISRGMGHSSERTTQTYIKSIDTSAIDRINRRLIRL